MMYTPILGRSRMSDVAGGWFYRSVDYTALGLILLGGEQVAQWSVKHLFGVDVPLPTMPLPASLSVLAVGYSLSFLGDKGPKLSRRLWGWMTQQSVRSENVRLRAELEILTKTAPIPALALQAPTTPLVVPPNAAEVVARWHKMFGDVQEKDDPVSALMRHKDYPSLRPYLSDPVKSQIESRGGLFSGLVAATSYFGGMDSTLRAAMDAADTMTKAWGGALTTPSLRISQEDRIKITLPLSGDPLSDKQPYYNGFTYGVRGTLRMLPMGHEIWLLTADDRTGEFWPQGFSSVEYNERTGDWKGRIHVGKSPLRVIALVAPLFSQQLFRYYQKCGDQSKATPKVYVPLDLIPTECENIASVQTRVPE